MGRRSSVSFQGRLYFPLDPWGMCFVGGLDFFQDFTIGHEFWVLIMLCIVSVCELIWMLSICLLNDINASLPKIVCCSSLNCMFN